MVETAKTTSMVFIILIGAAMLTSAFRAFGGEDLVREYLTSLPGGFWTQFVVVMAVIFLLGFFLDFIEIAVVVIPIVAPILLADPGANITAVWFGVMVGLNIQTSFLTPPFGFALFYLRGVAPAIVKTLEIYRGAAVFIALQLVGLAIAGLYPSLVNYLPNRVYLGSETAPPPMNPKLQHCLEEYVFAEYDRNGDALRAHVDRAAALEAGFLPGALREKYEGSLEHARAGIGLAQAVREADAAVEAYLPEYRPLHVEVRRMQSELRKLGKRLERLERDRSRLSRDETASDEDRDAVEREIARVEAEMAAIEAGIPAAWEEARARYVALSDTRKKVRREYRQSVDEAYQTVADLRALIADADALRAFQPTLASLEGVVVNDPPEQAMGDHQGGGAGARRGGGQQPDQGPAVEGPPGAARQCPGPGEGGGLPGRGARALRGGGRVAHPRGRRAAAGALRVRRGDPAHHRPAGPGAAYAGAGPSGRAVPVGAPGHLAALLRMLESSDLAQFTSIKI